jgi:hypothetical protein
MDINYYVFHVRFEVLTAVTMKSAIVCDVTSCSLVEAYQNIVLVMYFLSRAQHLVKVSPEYVANFCVCQIKLLYST